MNKKGTNKWAVALFALWMAVLPVYASLGTASEIDDKRAELDDVQPVSYTHLTLPTKLVV